MRADLLLFVSGAWMLQFQSRLPAASWAWLLIPGMILALWAKGMARKMLLGACFFAAGFLYAAAMAQIRLADALSPEWEGRDVVVEGVISSLPVPGEKADRFEFSVRKTVTQGAAIPEKILLSRYLEPGLSPLHAGQKWRFMVRLKRPHGNVNPHGYDYEGRLLEEGIRATGYVRNGVLLDDFVPSPGTLIERAREAIRDRILQKLRNLPHAGVIAALVMGDQRSISSEEWQTFRRTGVIHLMSISGLHVTMIAGLSAFLCHFLWRRSRQLVLMIPARKAAAVAGLLAAFFYSLLAGYAVPTQRTVYMLAVVAVSFWSGRSNSSFSILCWALFVVILFDPWAVLAAGFWLSFLAVFLILHVGSGRIARPGIVSSWISVQWAMTVGLVPALLIFFGQISLVSPFANALAIPLVSFVVVPLALMGAIFPPLLVLAQACFFPLMVLLQWMEKLPDAVWVQHSPPAWSVPVAFLGVLLILLPRGVPSRWLGGFFLLPMFLVLPEIPGSMRVAVLDVGQGLSVVVQTRHHALLYDAGPVFSKFSDSGNRVIVPYLRGEGVGRLDAMVLSHDDSDHTGGAASVRMDIPVSGTIASFPVASGMRCRKGQSWNWDGVSFEMLSPESSGLPKSAGKNSSSCVLRIAADQGAVLLAGDIERSVESGLAESGKVHAEVLVVPHHGGASAYSPSFAKEVSPRYAVFTVGYRNRFGHPKPGIVSLYAASGAEILRTDRDGALLFDFTGKGILVRSWRRERARYWYQEK